MIRKLATKYMNFFIKIIFITTFALRAKRAHQESVMLFTMHIARGDRTKHTQRPNRS